MGSNSVSEAVPHKADRDFQVTDDGSGAVSVHFLGAWLQKDGLPPIAKLREVLEGRPETRVVRFDTSQITGWDSGIVTFAMQASDICSQRGIELDRSGLPAGAARLLKLAEAVPDKADARAEDVAVPILQRIGQSTLSGLDGGYEALAFIGETTVAFGHMLRGTARFRWVDLWLMVQHAGADALPIITLISLLVGTIFAFVGAVQLEQFGATVYVADLVSIAMIREMGAMMTAIVMAGRTGAAFAAQLGSMKVNQEIDALQTMGISPLEYLVLPRMIALSAMMPLLAMYANVIGILGGAIIGLGMLDLSPAIYIEHTISVMTFGNLIGGLVKASVYGVLVALSGCWRGMQSGDSASAVGDATTAAVVTSIVLIICAAGLFAVMFYVLGI